MNSINVRLGGFLEDTPEVGILCNIYNRKDFGKGLRNLYVPFRDDVQVDLAKGHYTIEAQLPSGEVVRQNFEVTDSTRPQNVEIRLEDSPHEWLGWQQIVGNVEREGYQLLLDKPVSEVKTDQLSISATYPPRSRFQRGFFFQIPGMNKLVHDRQLEQQEPFKNLERIGVEIIPLKPDEFDDASEVYFFNIRRGNRHLDYGRFMDMLSQYQNNTDAIRNYLFFRGEGIPAQYCALPIPWINPLTEEPVGVEVQFYNNPIGPKVGDTGHRISVVVRDSYVGTLLGYLGTGNILSAAEVMKQSRAESILYSKRINPLAAVVGGYILLATQEIKNQVWLDWIKNLNEWFPWIPDGAILYAWTLLKKKDISAKEKREAKKNLLMAYKRGIPFYTKGVKLLLDGLRIFDNEAKALKEPDKVVETALKMIWRLSTLINVRQPFTTVLLESEGKKANVRRNV